MPSSQPPDRNPTWIRIAGQCSFIPIYLALFPIAFYFIGEWLDGYFGTTWIANLMLFLGLITGFRETFFLIRRLLREQERMDRGTR